MGFSEALRSGQFVVTCEFVPGRGADGAAIRAPIEFARRIRKDAPAIHAISLTDSPGGTPALSPDVLAAEMEKEGVEALVHVACRDLNRNAFEARAMALARNGIHNLLVLTGDYPEGGYEGHAEPVFDLDSVQAIRYLHAMNGGLVVPGAKPGTTESLPPTEFCIGAAVSPFKATEAELLPQFFKLEKKIAAGAEFIISQLGYDMRKFFEIRLYLASRGLNVPVLGNVYVLSYGAAKAMAAGKVPGCVVSPHLLEVLEQESKLPDRGKQARLERAAKMLAVFRGMGFAGVHIGGFGLKPEDYLFVIRRGEELGGQWEGLIPDVSFPRAGDGYAFPEPARYKIERPEAPPAPGTCRSPFAYSMNRLVHWLAFREGGFGYHVLRGYYQAIDRSRALSGLSHVAERAVKRVLFDCRDCGDCSLPDTAYCCPQGGCAKQQRNGPCGGSRDGMCEVYPDEKPCVWTRIYERLKSTGRLEEMRTGYLPPRDWALADTSGWANYFLKRDYAARTRSPEVGGRE